MESPDGVPLTKRRKIGGTSAEPVSASLYESSIIDFNVLIVEPGFAKKQSLAVLDCKYFASRVPRAQDTTGIYVDAGRGASQAGLGT